MKKKLEEGPKADIHQNSPRANRKKKNYHFGEKYTKTNQQRDVKETKQL